MTEFERIRPEEVEKNTNTDFDTTLDEPTRRDKGADMGVLFPDPKNVCFWHELYGREDDELNAIVTAVEADGADMTGPVDGSEDPILLATKVEAGKVPGPSPYQAATSSRPSASGSTELERSDLSSSSGPSWSPSSSVSLDAQSRPRSRNAGGGLLDSHPGPSVSPSLSTVSMQSPSPWNLDASQQQDLLRGIGGGAKSMWGKLSSRASTAFTAVQGAYGDVSREMKGVAATQGWTIGSDTDGKELQSRGTSSADYRDVSEESEARWNGSSMTGKRETAAPSWTVDAQVPTERWKTERATRGLSSLTLENPWQSPASHSDRQPETRAPGKLPPLSGQNSVKGASPSSSSNNVQQSEGKSSSLKESTSGDPLGVLW